MATSKDAARAYTGDYPVVFDAVCRAAQEMGMTLAQADPATGVITGKSSVSLSTWGENLTINVWQETPGTIQVRARSGLKFGLVDWGKNQKNLNQLFLKIDQALSGPGAAPLPGVAQAAVAAQPAAAWHPDPSGRHEHRYWDGQAWSDQVSDSGTVTSDPL